MALEKFKYPSVYHYYDGARRDRACSYYTMYYVTAPVERSKMMFNYVEHFNGFDYTSHTSENTALEIPLMSFANGVVFKWKSYLSNNTSTNVSITGPIVVYDKDGTEITNDFNYAFKGNTSREYLTINPFKIDGIDVDNIKFDFVPYRLQYSVPSKADAIYVFNAFFRKFNEDLNVQPLSGLVDSTDVGKFWDSNSAYQITSDASFNAFFDAVVNHGDGTPITPILPSEDTSHTGGGDESNPNYDPFSDPINSPNVPTISSLDTGFISAYNPTKVQLQQVASVMWTDNFIEELKKIWNSPIEGIISLHMVPFAPPTYGYANCKIGNYNTQISMKAIFSQYIKLQGGNIHVDERWCSALDYSPYTRAFIHIPFVGIQPVNIDDVMNKTVTLEYIVDVLTGSGVAFLKCNDAVLHTYPCNMSMKIPFTMSDHQLLYQSLTSMAGNVAKALAAGGNSPSANAGALNSAMNVVLTKHSTVSKSGTISSTYGMLDNFTAYIILHRPIQSLASDFGHFKGYPCNITYTLSSLSGYTEVEYAHLEGVTATDAEKEEIQNLLSQGVIL